jgi:hypothetical protein
MRMPGGATYRPVAWAYPDPARPLEGVCGSCRGAPLPLDIGLSSLAVFDVRLERDGMVVQLADEIASALSNPVDRPTTAREAEVMAEAVARAARALLDDEHVLPGAEVIDE